MLGLVEVMIEFIIASTISLVFILHCTGGEIKGQAKCVFERKTNMIGNFGEFVQPMH